MADTLNADWRSFVTQLNGVLPVARRVTDLARRVAYSTDASFYTLIPKLVLFPNNTENWRQYEGDNVGLVVL